MTNSNLELNNFKLACSNFKSIAMRYKSYVELHEALIGSYEDLRVSFDICTKLELINKNYFGSIWGVQCFISPRIQDGFIEGCSNFIYDYKDGTWSTPISLSDINFKKRLQLKTFW